MRSLVYMILFVAAGWVISGCNGGRPNNASESAPTSESESAADIASQSDSVNASQSGEIASTVDGGANQDFVGDYTYTNDGSTLEIGNRPDSALSVKIGLFRLTDIDDGIGRVADGSLIFNATDAAGNPIKGKITLDADTAVLTFTESTWGYLPNGTTFRFRRDTPAEVRERSSLIGKTYSGGGNGGGLAIDLTIDFMADSICECTSNFYQAFPKPVKVKGMYFVRDGIVDVICRPEGFEDSPIEWYFSIKDNGEELSFDSSDADEVGSIGKDWITLKKE